MKSVWQHRVIATSIYTVIAITVAWICRDALYYLDGWVIFTSIAAIPVLVLLGYYLWERAYSDTAIRWQKYLVTGFTVVISLATLWLVYIALCIDIIAATTPVNNIRKYEFIINKWNSPFIAHFPRPIPTGIQAVRFLYVPGFLQAKRILELGYTTTPGQVDALYREYSHCSLLTFTAGTDRNYIEPVNYVAEGVQDPIRFTGDYTLFYLDEYPPTSKNRNDSSQGHGVAISRKRCRIVFWAWSG